MDQCDESQESERAAALKRYQILNSGPEPAFDRLIRLTASMFNAPIVAITLTADDCSWSKWFIGLDSPEHIGKSGFFGHLIEGGETLVVEDASADHRFADDPLVRSAPNIRFYAGAPLITPGGQRIGTLSLADTHPRSDFSVTGADQLKDLACLVIDQLELRLERLGSGRVGKIDSAFFAAMSHETRTPMNGVLGMAELLLTADDLNDRHRHRVEVIKRSGATVLSWLDHMIELFRIETEVYAPDTSSFSLLEIVQDVRTNLKLSGSNETIELDLVEDCLHVVGDAPRLKKLFSYFLNSAVTTSTKAPFRMFMAAKPAADERTQVRFEIQDADIATGTVRRMLAACEQDGRISSSDVSEAGLGLNICKRLALMMGGDIGVKNLAGEDPIFWLDISLCQQAGRAASEVVPMAPAATEIAGDKRTVRDVLVAEDNPDMALLIEDLLEDAGYRATIAPDGASALEILGEQHFDVVLMDGRMPDMSGFEAADLIRKLPDERANIPIIALTAEALAGDRERYLSAGMDDYVAKPVDHETLIGAIERCCNEQRRQSSANTGQLA